METREAARRWARIWQSNWEKHEAPPIVALYAEGALFQPHPFRAPEPARDYVERVFADEASTSATFEEPIVDGDRAVVEWRARTQLNDGRKEILSGASLLRFDADGLVVEHRDVWCAG